MNILKDIGNISKAILSDLYTYYSHRRVGRFVSFVSAYFDKVATDEEDVYKDSVMRLALSYNAVPSTRRLFNKIADLMEGTQTLILNGEDAGLVKDFLRQKYTEEQ